MGLHSGKFGVVDGHSTVQAWSINETSSPVPFVASNTRGGTGRLAGNRDWTGNFNVLKALPLLMPGETFTFTGYTAPDNDVSGTGKTKSGPAIVESVQVSWDWGAAAIIASLVNFAANGALVHGTGTHTDATIPAPPSSIGTKITVVTGVAWDVETEWENLLTAQLTITQASQAYVNSSSAGQTKRKMGVLDWSLAVTHQGDPDDLLFNIGDDVFLRLYVDDTNYWELALAHARETTGITVDRQSGAIIQETVNLDMSGVLDAATLGRIRKPGAPAVDWWPFVL